ncbi:MAG: response regulator [Bdellovibrionales bacterium]|nr:response regulator [Bdellovibrionales bacterium]
MDKEVSLKPVLVVDDSRSARFTIRKVLETNGYSVLEAESGRAALELLKTNEISFITLDVEMPELDGYETCRLIRQLELIRADTGEVVESVPTVFVTGNDSFEGRVKGFEAGACEFVSKNSIQSGELIRTVDHYLRPTKLYEGLKVLLADDSKMVHLMVERIIRSLGAVPHSFLDGQAAYDHLKDTSEEYSLILLDNHMPQMTGLELVGRIRRELGLRLTPVLFISGAEDRESQLQFFKAGASDYVIKPFLLEELLARIRVNIQASRA